MRLLLAALALLIAAAPAQAAPPWSDPVTVSTAREFVDDPGLAFARDGTALASWSAPGAGTFAAALGSPEHLVSGTSLVSSPVLYATDRAVVTTQRAAGAKTRLSVVFGRASGTFGAPQTIAVRQNLRGAQIAANAQGDIAIAWFEDRGVTTDRVYVAFRPHGKPFTPPILQATDRVRSVSVAVGPRGDVLLAYDARGIVKTRFKPARAALFRRVQTLESEPAFYAQLHTAVTGNGRAYVAWAAQLLTEGGDRGQGFYEAAVQPAGATRFRAAQLFEQTPPTVAVGHLDLVVDDANRATVAWGSTTVRATTSKLNGDFRSSHDVAPGLEAALATSPDGRTVVAWIANPGDAQDGAIEAAFAPADGLFGAPETVTTGPEARVPVAAFDPASNRFGLAWSNRPNGETAPIRTFLQASLRPAS